MNNDMPMIQAMTLIMKMNLLISLAIGLIPLSNPDAKTAMRPITVLSPVLITIPTAVPSTALVEKKAKF